MFLQHRSDLLQRHIARIVAKGVVDPLEVIDIQREHRVLLAGGFQQLQECVQRTPIGQPGQRVALRFLAQAAELLFEQLHAGAHGLADGQGIVVPGLHRPQRLSGLGSGQLLGNGGEPM
ncbi:MAG: hypothetical protein GAK43_02487 [Stenotrophomonas maltophilia]|nr:MAG: hypothetical protein GAK43_02487 [Stenotrophomonas maltophilia]